MTADTDSRLVERALPDIPLLGDLSPRLLAALLEELRVETHPAGAVLVRQGEYAERLFVHIEGTSLGRATDLDGHSEVLQRFGPSEWFGEMTILSNQPQHMTVVTETPSTLAVLDGPLGRKLLAGGGSFRRLIDERYRERSLAIHLGAVPVFKGLAPRILDGLALQSEIRHYETGAVIAVKGETADAVYLVRSGVVRRVEITDEGEHVVAYHCDNSTFGERTLTNDRTWSHTFIAMTRTDVVYIAGDVLRGLAQQHPEAHAALMTTVSLLSNLADSALQRRFDPGRVSRVAPVDLIISKQVSGCGEALAVDLDKCIRCQVCVRACAASHEDGIPRVSRRGIRLGHVSLSSACYACSIPECMLGCTHGAIRRGIHGSVHFIRDACTGCSACAFKCPYGVIRMAPAQRREGRTPSGRSLTARFLPFLRRTASSPASDAESVADRGEGLKAVKCDQCAGLPYEACVYTCPCGAITTVSPDLLVR